MSIPLVDRVCPLCGSAGSPHVYAPADFDTAKWDAMTFASRKIPENMHFRLLECEGCDVVYASPAPMPDALAQAYESAGYDSGVEAKLAARSYGALLGELKTQLPDLSGALDIGAGDGAFLEELVDAGFSGVTGIEPSAAPIASASERVRPLLRQGVFREGLFPSSSLSLVTCFQTLEHVPDPLKVAQSAHTLLKPGGAVYFVAHNRRAVSARVMGRKSPIFDVEHLQLFSPKSLETMLKRAGFVHVSVRPFINRYPVHYWARLAPLPSSLKGPLLPALKEHWAGRVLIPLPAGNLSAIAFKPM